MPESPLTLSGPSLPGLPEPDISRSLRSGLALIMARTGGPGGKGVSAFLVPTDTPGFTANKIHGKLGLRSCDAAELVLDDVEVAEDALLGG